jgi:hypothetical protein
MNSSTKHTELQCPCEIPLSEKRTVDYDFGLLGSKTIKVCNVCIKEPPYNKFILDVRDDSN